MVGTEPPLGPVEDGLFNNDQAGRFLVVWDVTISHSITNTDDPATATCGFQIYQSPGLLPYIDPVPLNPTLQYGPGVGWFNGTSPGFRVDGQIGPRFIGNVNWSWPHDWPFCVVPAGWSLSCVFVGSATFSRSSCAFTYEATGAL